MPYKDFLPILDVASTADLFGDVPTAVHLYRVLHGVLPKDHEALQIAFHMQNIETVQSVVHRIKGALRYCKTPEYHDSLCALESAVRQHRFPSECLDALDFAYARLVRALNELVAL